MVPGGLSAIGDFGERAGCEYSEHTGSYVGANDSPRANEVPAETPGNWADNFAAVLFEDDVHAGVGDGVLNESLPCWQVPAHFPEVFDVLCYFA